MAFGLSESAVQTDRASPFKDGNPEYETNQKIHSKADSDKMSSRISVLLTCLYSNSLQKPFVMHAIYRLHHVKYVTQNRLSLSKQRKIMLRRTHSASVRVSIQKAKNPRLLRLVELYKFKSRSKIYIFIRKTKSQKSL